MDGEQGQVCVCTCLTGYLTRVDGCLPIWACVCPYVPLVSEDQLSVALCLSNTAAAHTCKWYGWLSINTKGSIHSTLCAVSVQQNVVLHCLTQLHHQLARAVLWGTTLYEVNQHQADWLNHMRYCVSATLCVFSQRPTTSNMTHFHLSAWDPCWFWGVFMRKCIKLHGGFDECLELMIEGISHHAIRKWLHRIYILNALRFWRTSRINDWRDLSVVQSKPK